MTHMNDLPIIKLQHGRDRRVLSGHPWVYSNEIAPDPALQALEAGSLVRVVSEGGKALGTASYNPKTLIAARLLTRDAEEAIDQAYFERRLSRALALRTRLFDKPYYRLVHAEADGLPGTILDRYGDVVVVQTNAAGSDRLLDLLLDALHSLLAPRAVVLRNDSPARATEGLEAETEIVRGALDGPMVLEENGAKFAVELASGQKTGWFYDQRGNRAFMAELAKDAAKVLDMYTYAGGFAVQCALAGAKHVTAVDRSEGALELVNKAAALNGVEGKITTKRAEAFRVLEELQDRGEKFDVVIADPPAFIKSRKDANPGLKAYGKLARLAARLVNPGGFLFIASCSYHAETSSFTEAVGRGVADAKRGGRILRTSGAGADHPVHPLLPESAYLKALTLQLD